MTDLFIHIGAPKTGTTAIQHYLTRQRKALRAAGTLYPRAGVLEKQSAHHMIGAAVHPERRRRLSGADPDAVLAEAVAGVRAEMEACAPRRVILSSEYLWGELPPARVAPLLALFAADCTLTVVAYLRRQDLFAQSLYMQAVKGGGARDFASWFEEARGATRAGMHFDRVLATWTGCGIPVRPLVRVYEEGQIDRDVCRDFVEAVCPEVGFAGTAGGGVNASTELAAIELMRRVNSVIGNPETANAVRRKILRLAPPRETFAPINYLSGAEVAAFMAEFADGNRAIARDILRREDGVLFRQPLPAPEVAASAVSEAAVLERLLQVLPDIVAAVPPPDVEGRTALSPERRRARRQRRLAAAESAAEVPEKSEA